MFTEQELHALLTTLNASTIKAIDAKFVAQLQEKLINALTPPQPTTELPTK